MGSLDCNAPARAGIASAATADAQRGTGGVMQPGAGTTVERQVAGEFGDRSPVLKPNQTKQLSERPWRLNTCGDRLFECTKYIKPYRPVGKEFL